MAFQSGRAERLPGEVSLFNLYCEFQFGPQFWLGQSIHRFNVSGIDIRSLIGGAVTMPTKDCRISKLYFSGFMKKSKKSTTKNDKRMMK